MTTIGEFRKQIIEHMARLRETGEDQDCPVCDQGTLIGAEVVETGERITFCEECDSIWSNDLPINDAHAEAFQSFVNGHGKQGLDWTEIKIA